MIAIKLIFLYENLSVWNELAFVTIITLHYHTY